MIDDSFSFTANKKYEEIRFFRIGIPVTDGRDKHANKSISVFMNIHCSDLITPI